MPAAPARAAGAAPLRNQRRQRRHVDRQAPRPLRVDLLRQPVRHRVLLVHDPRHGLGALAVHQRRHLQRARCVALPRVEALVAGGVGVLEDGGDLVHLAVGLGGLEEGREALGAGRQREGSGEQRPEGRVGAAGAHRS